MSAMADRAPRRWSVRTFLASLVLVCLLPGVAGAILLLAYEYREARGDQEKDTMQTARALMQAVDNQLLRAQTVAQTLATADSLARGDFAAFHKQARQVLAQAGLGLGVSVVGPDERSLLNTLAEYGKPLPPLKHVEHIRRVFATGGTALSNLFEGSVARRPVMSVGVPVMRDGKVAYELNLFIGTEAFAGILRAQGLPPGWVATILDGGGTVVARSLGPDEIVGTKAPPDFLQLYTNSDEGMVELASGEDTPNLEIFTRSPVSAWGVSIGIPSSIRQSSLTHHLAILAGGIAALFGLGLGFAWVIGGRIAHSVKALAGPAAALGSGDPAPIPPVYTEVAEVAEVGTALGRAAALLRERAAVLRARELQLHESESSLRELIATLPGMVWTTGPDGKVDFISQRWYDYTGAQENSQCGDNWLESIHPDDRDGIFLAWSVAVESRGRFDVEYRLLRHDGAYRWFKSRGRPLHGNDGRVSRWLGVVTDIHDLKVSQEALAASQAELLESQRLARLGTWFWDANTDTVTTTAELLRIFGRDSLPPFAEQFGTFFAPEVWHRVRAAASECVLTGAGCHLEVPALRSDGSTVWIALRGERVAHPPTSRYSLRGTAQDVSERKAAEQEIERLNADLERRVAERTAELTAANRELEGFTFATSHDLRGPLGRINSFSALLESRYRDRLEGEGLLFLNFVRQNAVRLHQLVDDLLDHARMTRQTLELQPLDVPRLVDVVLQDKREDLLDAGAELRLGIPPGKAHGDLHAFTQALANLLENALKYSAQAKPPVIEIGGEQDAGRYRLWVRDNGIGFDMAYHDRIFEIFRRLHTYNQYPGTGVGLALVKRAVERMGGRVWADSAPGAGATFYLELDLAQA